MKPLAIDLYCGLGGWSEGLLLEGYDVVGFDIEQHVYGEHRYPAQMVIQDVLSLHGAQFKDAALIVASPPCQAYSYRAMPWKRAKALPPPCNDLFNACFRIQREACAAAGLHIPLVVENVLGAQKWVGQARAHYGSFYLWGDVPALLPIPLKRGVKVGGLDWSKHGQPDYKISGAAGCFRDSAIKNSGGSWFGVAHNATSGKGRNPDGRPLRNDPRDNIAGIKQGGDWFSDPGSASRTSSSKSSKRKFASALIAKIPLELSRYIARIYKPQAQRQAGAA